MNTHVKTVSARRWLQFSLKTYFVLVTLSCLWLSSLAVHVRRQELALKQIWKLGGEVAFDIDLDANGSFQPIPQPFVSEWLRNTLGSEYLRRITLVSFERPSCPADDDLIVLQELPCIEQLVFSNCKHVTDAGLVHLSGLTSLKVLLLNGVSINGSGLDQLRQLEHLEGVALSSTPLTDQGLENLKSLATLKWLHLNDTKISDKGLEQLATLQNLEELDLVNTEITDAGLKKLASLRQLKRVWLRGTKTTPEGRAALQNALPYCRVPI